jgi:hypothetical protein
MKPFVVFVVVLVAAAAVLGAYSATVKADHAVPFKSATYYELQGNLEDGSHLFVGTGVGSHIGRSTTVAYVLTNRPVGYSVHGTITAANGDEINFSGGAKFTSPTTTQGTVSLMGGTGRFENATGVFNYEEVLTYDPTHTFVIAVQQAGTGLISY